VIDDVINHDEVSRGTFYKHFQSLEHAIAELAGRLAEEMTADIYDVFGVLEDPRERSATVFQLFLRRAMADPSWGGFIAHIGLLEPENSMIRNTAQDIQAGLDAGLYDLQSVECGLDLLVRTKIKAIRRVIRGGYDHHYIQGMAALVLRAFGRPPREAADIASAMATRLDIWPASAGPHEDKEV
jgi:AcrR family transcriptional regulator